MDKETQKYGDIMYIPRPVSKRHKQMPRQNRAAQFASFAALTGYEESVKEIGRLTSRRLELDPDRQDMLNRNIMYLSRCSCRPYLQITYFRPDKNKSGGKYITVSGNFRRIEEETMELILTDGSRISVLDIYEICGGEEELNLS